MSTGPGPWPAEDGGPARTQRASGPVPTGTLAAVRDVAGAAMVIVRAPGEVFLYGSVLAADSTAWVERLDPATLDPVARVELAGGPWWPGGLAAHADGSLHVVHGRHAHRLSPALEVLASAVLPRPRAHNSFVTLPDGGLVTKDLGLDRQEPAHLVVLDPERLEIVAEADAPEPSIARLSALGDDVYLVGDDTVFRYRWDGRALTRDDTWSFRYRTAPDQSYGWDPVLAGEHVWFLDNGEHTFAGSMLGQGVAVGPVHLVRVAINDAADHELVEVSGRAGGAVTNPPVYDAARRIAVGYDSANGVLAAFDFVGSLRPRWQRELATAGHLLLYPDAGVLMAYDHRAAGEDVVFVDVESGEERARVGTGSMIQSVVFPAADGAGAAYYVSFGCVARIT